MQPANLLGNSVFGLLLNILVNGRPQVIPFHRRNDLFDLFSHVLRVDRDHLIAILPAQLSLILQLQTIEADKFIILVCQSRVVVDLFHCILNIFINIEAA
ncbi:hypothetical protein D3C81_1272710 [compost metagenome]